MFRPESPVADGGSRLRASTQPDAHWPDQAHRPLLAWLASLVLHTTLLLITAFFADRALLGLHDRPDGLRDTGAADNGSDLQREVQVALVHRWTQPSPPAELADRPIATEQATDGNLATRPDASSASIGVAQDFAAAGQSSGSTPPRFAPTLDLDAVLADLLATPDLSAASGISGGAGLGSGGAGSMGMLADDGESGKPGDRGLKAAGGGTGASSLFGIEGVGNRIVYVIDRSDSMNGNGGRPWQAAKTELIASLSRLDRSQFFQLILYNDQPSPYRGTPSAGAAVQWLQAEKSALDRAQSYLETANAFGGTNHLDALQMALRMRPDVIYFLTDGRVPSLSQRELSDIARIAQTAGTTIHAIEFGNEASPDPTSFVPTLASANRGKYRYFDVHGFSLEQSGGRAERP